MSGFWPFGIILIAGLQPDEQVGVIFTGRCPVLLMTRLSALI